jgi:hypothetical protein
MRLCSSPIRFDIPQIPSAASLGHFPPRLEPVFEVIPDHSAALAVDLLGAAEDFLNLQPVVALRIGRAHVLRLETIVNFDL